MWCSAHAIFYFHQGQDASFLVHENIYLIDAPNAQQALYEAEALGKRNQDMNETGELALAGKPV